MSPKLSTSLSLILPIYNEEASIEGALSKCVAALENDFEDFEIIVVDDGSKDNTYTVVEKIARTNSRIKVIRNLVNLNQGVSIQRGFVFASKEIIMHNGIDLPFDPQKTRSIVEQFKDNDVVVLERKQYAGATSWRLITSKINIWLRVLLFPKLTRGITDMNFIQFYSSKLLPNILPLAKSPAFTTPEMIFRAKILNAKVKQIPFEFQPREVGSGSLGKVHDITWSMYDMFRFRYLLWVGIKKHGKTK